MNSSEIFLRGWHLVILGRNSPKNHPVYLFPLWCSIKVTTRIRSKKEFLEVLERIPRFRTKETQMQEVSKFKLKQRLTWLGSNKYRTNSSPNKTGKPEKSLRPKFDPRQNPYWPKSTQGEAQFGNRRGGKQNLAQKDWGVYSTWTYWDKIENTKH